MNKKLLTAAALVGSLTCANAATISFTSEGFNDINQLSTSGTLIDAAQFGEPGETDVTVSGITFDSVGGASTNLRIGGLNGYATGSFGTVANAAYYDETRHIAGFQDITGMTTAQEDSMFDAYTFGSGVGNHGIELIGLTIGQVYLFQTLTVEDRTFTANNTLEYRQADGTVALTGLDHTSNFVVLVNGSFVADATNQFFQVDSGADNVLLTSYQLRAVPEPSSTALLGLTGLTLLLRRRN